MKFKTKLILAGTAATVLTAFCTGVAYELHNIRKLTTNPDADEPEENAAEAEADAE